jgi:[CysO sulfur-carrier protein]-S-L-cysteine hydrolase
VYPLGSKKKKEENLRRKGLNSNLRAADATPKESVILPIELKKLLISNCRKGLPNEACGLISGKGNVCTNIYATTNVDPSPFTFAISLDEEKKIEDQMRKKNESMIGIYHSHPHGTAIPSKDDLEFAPKSPDIYYFIISVSLLTADIRCYKITNRFFSEVKVIIQ